MSSEWTDERVQKLRDMWTDGMSASQIANELGGVTRNAVIGKAHRLGLQKRPSPIKRQGVSILDLKDRMCRWPNGHPGETGFHFCGKTTVQGMPYCNDHCLQAYQAPTSKKDRQRNEAQRQQRMTNASG